MMNLKSARIGGWVAGLLVTALLGCGEEEGPSPRTETATKEAARCAMVDATDPEVARSLTGTKLTQLGPPTVRYVDGKKISSQRLLVEESADRSQAGLGESRAPRTLGVVVKSCAGTCTGMNCSAPKGCEPALPGGECTDVRCDRDCTGSCTKTTEYEPDAGTSDAGTSDAGASDAGASDAGASDAGASDAGASDAGASDAGASSFRSSQD